MSGAAPDERVARCAIGRGRERRQVFSGFFEACKVLQAREGEVEGSGWRAG